MDDDLFSLSWTYKTLIAKMKNDLHNSMTYSLRAGAFPKLKITKVPLSKLPKLCLIMVQWPPWPPPPISNDPQTPVRPNPVDQLKYLGADQPEILVLRNWLRPLIYILVQCAPLAPPHAHKFYISNTTAMNKITRIDYSNYLHLHFWISHSLRTNHSGRFKNF